MKIVINDTIVIDLPVEPPLQWSPGEFKYYLKRNNRFVNYPEDKSWRYPLSPHWDAGPAWELPNEHLLIWGSNQYYLYTDGIGGSWDLD